MLAPLTVRDVMVESVTTIEPDQPVRAATALMADSDVGSLVVCEGERPVGILTTSDVIDLVADAGNPDETLVESCLSAPVVTIAPDASVEEAAATLRDEGIKRLPVVDDGDLVGIVTVTDLSYYLPQIAVGRRPSRRRPADRPEVAYEGEGWQAEVDAEGDEPEVGDVVRFTKQVSDDDVRSFAAASGDTNRVHLDDEFAVGSRFGERIVHGTLVVGLISAALARLPGLTIYLSQDSSFHEPVPIGATLTAVCEVVESLGGNRYRVSTAVYHDDDVVLDGDATILIDDLHEAVPLDPEAIEH